MKHAVITLFICAWGTAGAAPAKTGEVKLLGHPRCVDWIEARGAGKAWPHEAWLNGYLSGRVISKGQDLLAGIPARANYLFIDEHCRTKPLEDVLDGAEALLRELARQARP